MTSDIKKKHFFVISVIELSIKVFSTLVTLQNYINYRNRKKPIFQKFENLKKGFFVFFPRKFILVKKFKYFFQTTFDGLSNGVLEGFLKCVFRFFI